jgi:hypothetical protein
MELVLNTTRSLPKRQGFGDLYPILIFFDPAKELILEGDASNTALDQSYSKTTSLGKSIPE